MDLLELETSNVDAGYCKNRLFCTRPCNDGKPSSNPKTQEAEAGDLCQLQACQVYTASSRPARDTPCDPVSQKKKLLTDRTLAYHHKVQNSCQNTHTHTPTKMPILKEKNLEQVE